MTALVDTLDLCNTSREGRLYADAAITSFPGAISSPHTGAASVDSSSAPHLRAPTQDITDKLKSTFYIIAFSEQKSY